MDANSHNNRPTLVLASGSPQRRLLLQQAGYAFRVVAPRLKAECGICDQESPPQMVARLAHQKAADVAEQLAGAAVGADVIVACDTLVECRGQILGKPANRDNAQRMLEWLRGQRHRVYSGLCVWPVGPGELDVQVARTTLKMDDLSDDQIAEYLDSGAWEGKAGAFGYQDRAGWLHIEEGSESNVIGLPLELLGRMLGGAREGSSSLDEPANPHQ